MSAVAAGVAGQRDMGSGVMAEWSRRGWEVRCMSGGPPALVGKVLKA